MKSGKLCIIGIIIFAIGQLLLWATAYPALLGSLYGFAAPLWSIVGVIISTILYIVGIFLGLLGLVFLPTEAPDDEQTE